MGYSREGGSLRRVAPSFCLNTGMNCLEIIIRAQRRLGVLAAGQLPDEIEVADHIDVLKSIYLRWITAGTFGELPTILVEGPDHIAAPNTRVVALSPVEVILPLTVTSGSTVTTPRDGSVIVVVHRVTNTTENYIYDATTHDWLRVDFLSPTDIAPLSGRDPIGLACTLAVEIAAEYGQEISELMVRNATIFQTSLTHDYSNPDDTMPGVYY